LLTKCYVANLSPKGVKSITKVRKVIMLAIFFVVISCYSLDLPIKSKIIDAPVERKYVCLAAQNNRLEHVNSLLRSSMDKGTLPQTINELSKKVDEPEFFVCYVADFLIRNRVDYRFDFIQKNLALGRVKVVYGILNVLHLALFYDDIELIKNILSSEHGRELLLYKDQLIGERYSPLVMKLFSSTESDFINLLENLRECVSAEDLFNTGILHLAVGTLRPLLLDYLVNVREISVNRDFVVETPCLKAHERLLDPAFLKSPLFKGDFQKLTFEFSTLSSMSSCFIKSFVSEFCAAIDGNEAYNSLIFVSSPIYDRYEINSSSFFYYFVEDIYRPFRDSFTAFLSWRNNKDVDIEDKIRRVQGIFDVLSSAGYERDETAVLQEDIFNIIGEEGLRLYYDYFYKNILFDGKVGLFELNDSNLDGITGDTNVKAMSNNTIYEIIYKGLPFINRAIISNGSNLDFLCSFFKIGFNLKKRVTFRPQTISIKDRKISLPTIRKLVKRDRIIEIIIKFSDIFGVDKETLYRYSTSRKGTNTFLEFLQHNRCSSELINLAKDSGFLTTSKVKSKLLSAAIQKEKKRHENEEKRKEEEKARKASTSVKSSTSRKESRARRAVEKKEDIDYASQFESAIYNQNYDEINEALSVIGIESVGINWKDITDSRIRKSLIRRGIKIGKDLVASILELDQVDVMNIIVRERARDRDIVEAMVTLEEHEVKNEIGKKMLSALGGFRRRFQEINKKFRVIEDSERSKKLEIVKLKIYELEDAIHERKKLTTSEAVRKKIEKAIGKMIDGDFADAKDLEGVSEVREYRILGRDNIRIYYIRDGNSVKILKFFKKRDSVPLDEIKRRLSLSNFRKIK